MDPKKTPERKSTDESLDEERERATTELAEKRTTVEANADQVIGAARTKADALLHTAREVADRSLEPQAAAATVEPQRAREDAVVDSQRATEDEALRRERLAGRRALADLFKLERDKTDLQLLTERTQSDVGLDTRDTFLAMACHDLRTMLGGIAMTAAILVREGAAESGATVRARAETIQRFTARMNRLLGDLVDVGAIENGKLEMAPERPDLPRLLREADEGLGTLATARRIFINSDIIGQPLAADFDHARILQVLANLITNAIKFTPEGGRIAVRVEAREGVVLFSVRDSGLGIPPDKLEAVFQRYWQVQKHDRRGLGLGLYIARCIVEGHGGRIWAESQAGAGTTIFFTLPEAMKAV